MKGHNYRKSLGNEEDNWRVNKDKCKKKQKHDSRKYIDSSKCKFNNDNFNTRTLLHEMTLNTTIFW